MSKKMFWRDYSTQSSLRQKIRGIVNEQPFGEPFTSDLISDLIVERHYFCSTHGLRPKKFRKLQGYGPKGYSFEGDFSGLWDDPPIEWHKVSWSKCLKRPLSDWDRIVRAMRDRIEPIKRSYRDETPFCEDCFIAPSKEVHHHNPSFKDISEMVRDQVTEEDVADCLGAWNWFEVKDFALPEGHKITTAFDSIHDKAILEALCIDCHNRTKKKSN